MVKELPAKMMAHNCKGELCVVKRRGTNEDFDERKLYASVFEAARTCRNSSKKSEKMSETIVRVVKRKFKGKHFMDSQKIFEYVGEELKKLDPDVSFMYETHRDIS